MKRTALVVCRHQPSLRVLAEAFEDIGIDAQVCLSNDEATDLMVRGRYSAIVLDYDLPGAMQVAKIARMTAANLRPVVFAMVGFTTSVGDTLQSGINFVLYKPLDHEQITSSLRSARPLMRKERRRAHRQPLDSVIYLQFGATAIPALMLDISEQGLALQAPEPLPALPRISLRFMLPGTACLVEAVGDLIWADDSGRAGLFFSSVKPACRKHLMAWLGKRGIKRKDSVRALLQPQESRRARLAH